MRDGRFQHGKKAKKDIFLSCLIVGLFQFPCWKFFVHIGPLLDYVQTDDIMIQYYEEKMVCIAWSVL